MKMIMQASFTINAVQDGCHVPIIPHEETAISVGGFEFVVNGKVIPFDFDASGCTPTNGIYEYESGYGPFYNDFEISECFHDEIRALGLNPDDISAEYLSKVSEIRDFYINFEDKEMRERDNGEDDLWVELLDLCFIDRDTSETYPVDKSVLNAYNRSARVLSVV